MLLILVLTYDLFLYKDFKIFLKLISSRFPLINLFTQSINICLIFLASKVIKVLQMFDKVSQSIKLSYSNLQMFNHKPMKIKDSHINHPDINLQATSLIQESNNQISALILTLQRLFQHIKSQILISLSNVCKNMIDKISISSHKPQEQNFTNQLTKMKSSLQSLKQVLSAFQKNAEDYDCKISFSDQMYKLIFEKIETFQKFYEQKLKKHQHTAQNSSKHFNLAKNKSQKQHNFVYHYSPLNEEQQNQAYHPYMIRINQKTKNLQPLKNTEPGYCKNDLILLNSFTQGKASSSKNIEISQNNHVNYLDVSKKDKRKYSFNFLVNNISQKNYTNKVSCKSQKNRNQLSQNDEQPQKPISIEIKSPMQILQQIYRQGMKKVYLKNRSINIEKTKKDFFHQNDQNKISTKKSNQIKTVKLRKFSHNENQNEIKVRMKMQVSEQVNISQVKSHSDKRITQQTSQSLNSLQNVQLTINQLKSAAIYINALDFTSKYKIQMLKQSLKENRQNLSAAEHLSYSYLQQNSFHQCLQICNDVLRNFLNTEKIKDQNQKDLYHIICNKSAALNSLGRYSQTVKFLENYECTYHHFKLLKNLADAYFCLGRIQSAIFHYKRCLMIENSNDQVYYNIAACYYTRNRFSEAHQMVMQALKINANNSDYNDLQAQIKIHIG